MQKPRENALIIGIALVSGGLMTIVFVVYVAIVLDARAGMFLRNPSSSMEPTLLNGDYFTARRIESGHDVKMLRRGDLIVHQFPADPSKQFAKRLVGLPGDTLAMVSGVLLVNGRKLQEAYTQHIDSADPVTSDFLWQRPYLVGEQRRDSLHYVASRDTWGPLLVPPGQYFVLGDNRTRSLDSRWIGFIAAHEILGHVRRVYFSRDSLSKVRWSRIGRLLQ